MATINNTHVKEELVILLRNADIFTTAQRGVTTIAETFNGDASETEFVVSNLNIKNVRTITISAVEQTFGTDYLVNYKTGTITFTTAPASGVGNISISYDYGNTDKIYGEIPRVDLTLSSYPRIGVQVTGTRTSEGALDGSVNYTDFLISVYIYADKSNDVDSYSYTTRQTFLTNKKNIYYLRYITPVGETSIRNEDGRNNKIEFKTIDFIAPLNEEIN